MGKGEGGRKGWKMQIVCGMEDGCVVSFGEKRGAMEGWKGWKGGGREGRRGEVG
jgi:hypothetical protein